MKRYRYRKITPEDIGVMKELREKGLFYYKIAEKFGVNISTVLYHLSPREKIMQKKRADKSNNKMTEKQRQEKIKKAAPRMKKYMKERYNNDGKFRKDFLSMVSRNFEKRRKAWIEKGLCSQCGRKRKNKKWVSCERCREVSRKRDRTKKFRTKK